jgi:hypothetical protein
MSDAKIEINRAPVLTLWAAVVAERLGHGRRTALSLGSALAVITAQSKGRRLGVYGKKGAGGGGGGKGHKEGAGEGKAELPEPDDYFNLMGRAIPVVETDRGPRAAIHGKEVEPEKVERYLESKFGDHLGAARAAMESLAAAFPPSTLASIAFSLYEKFRPNIPRGKVGWGAKGVLDLGAVRDLRGESKE